MTDFEWDNEKAESNLAKHGVSFGEAMTVFGDPDALTFYDHVHSQAEDRFLTLGFSIAGRLIIVCHTDRPARTRIISARLATNRERKVYANERQSR